MPKETNNLKMTPAAFSFIGSTLRRQQIQKRDARWFLQSRKLFGVNALCINIATTIKEQLTKYKVVEIKLLLARPPFLAAIQDYPSEWAIKLWPATVSLMRSKLRGQLSWLCRIGSEFVQSKALGKEDERKNVMLLLCPSLESPSVHPRWHQSAAKV